MKLNFFGMSDTGIVRSANQDNFRVMRLSKDSAICVVCDGMGGARGGNVASEIAVDTFCEKLKKLVAPKINQGVLRLSSDTACRVIDDAVKAANSAVYKKSQSSKDFAGMGTTLVAVLFCGDIVYAANIGDSRLYIISNGAITQITHDHSYVQHLIDTGSLTPEEARTHPYRNRITRAVGIAPTVEADIFSIELTGLASCYLLLCSDGLHGMITPDEIRDIICDDDTVEEDASDEDEFIDELEKLRRIAQIAEKVENESEKVTAPENETDLRLGELVSSLVEQANDAGGIDNITAVLIKYAQEE